MNISTIIGYIEIFYEFKPDWTSAEKLEFVGRMQKACPKNEDWFFDRLHIRKDGQAFLVMVFLKYGLSDFKDSQDAIHETMKDFDDELKDRDRKLTTNNETLIIKHVLVLLYERLVYEMDSDKIISLQNVYSDKFGTFLVKRSTTNWNYDQVWGVIRSVAYLLWDGKQRYRPDLEKKPTEEGQTT